MKPRQKLFLEIKTAAVCFIVLAAFGCKKQLEVGQPVTSLTSADVFSNDKSTASVLTGIYSQMNGITGYTLNSVILYGALSSDELTLFPGAGNSTFTQYYTNNLSAQSIAPDFYYTAYPIIYTTNSVVENLNAASKLTPALRQQALGEAYFMRAFCYFYLVNLYGDVPLAITTDVKINSVLPRAPIATVYKQIINDLKSAQSLLSIGYRDGSLLNSTIERVRPTKWAATAFLARVYLYTSDWTDAAAQATNVINNTALFNLSDLNSVFLANNNEAIWQLQPVNGGENTPDALTFIIPQTGLSGIRPVSLSLRLLKSFEPGDQRLTNWVGKFIDPTTTPNNVYYYAYKYKVDSINAPVTEYEMVFRLGEQYLIRAEAEAYGAGGGLSGALADINKIRLRAGLPAIASVSNSDLLNVISHERQVELFTEWGHRWLDLKRTGKVDSVMKIVTPVKGGVWNTNYSLYPISLPQLKADPHLSQNSGY